MNIQTPKGWRKGQTLFNFLEWCRVTDQLPPNQNDRMGDPFHVSDEYLDELWSEYLKDVT